MKGLAGTATAVSSVTATLQKFIVYVGKDIVAWLEKAMDLVAWKEKDAKIKGKIKGE
jgi:hypothetical protein